MSMWNMEITLSLIKDLRNNPCLWDSSSPQYRLRNKKFEVYEELGKKYSVSASEVEKKIQSLRCQFRREQKKIKENENKMKVKCNWFGYTPLLFLFNQIEEANEKSVYDSTGKKIKSDMLDNSVEQDEIVENSEINFSYSIDSQSQTTTEDKSTNIVKTEPSSEIANGTLQCMKTLIDVVTKRDEFSVYGDYIADKLRNSGRSKIEIHIAQHHIDNVAFNLVMGVYGRGATVGAGAGIIDINTVSGVSYLALKEEKM